MNGLFEAALEMQHFFQQRDWRFCLIGGLAVVRWGEPRATRDVDVSLLTGIGAEVDYVDEILGTFQGRLTDARQFALENRVLLIAASNRIAVDIALAAFPFEEQMIDRATPFAFAPDASIITASAEDLIVLKAIAGRVQDWLDVEGIAITQATKLDWTYINRELAALCELKEDSEPLQRIGRIREQSAR